MAKFFALACMVVGLVCGQALWAKPTLGGQLDVPVQGMTCGSCVRTIEGHFSKQDAVEKASVDLDKNMLHLKFKTGRSLSAKEIREQLESLGYHTDLK